MSNEILREYNIRYNLQKSSISTTASIVNEIKKFIHWCIRRFDKGKYIAAGSDGQIIGRKELSLADKKISVFTDNANNMQGSRYFIIDNNPTIRFHLVDSSEDMQTIYAQPKTKGKATTKFIDPSFSENWTVLIAEIIHSLTKVEGKKVNIAFSIPRSDSDKDTRDLIFFLLTLNQYATEELQKEVTFMPYIENNGNQAENIKIIKSLNKTSIKLKKLSLSEKSKYICKSLNKLIPIGSKKEQIASEQSNPKSELIAAVKANNLESIKNLIEKQGVSVNTVDKNNTSILMYAVLQDKPTEIVKYLINKGAKLNTKNNYGNTALMLATLTSKKEVVETLLAAKASVGAKNNDNQNALMLSCLKGNKDIVALLVERDKKQLATVDKKGRTPLMLGSLSGRKEVVAYLLEQGAKTNSKDKQGNTAFSLACKQGDKDTVAVLFTKDKTQLEVPNKKGETPLRLAKLKDRAEVIRYLTPHVAEIKSLNSPSNPIKLFIAIINNDIDTIKSLLKADEDKLLVNSYLADNTLLMHASFNGMIEAVKLLLEKGAYTNTTNKNGETALTLACKKGFTEIVEVLLDKDKSLLNTPDIKNNTPLMIASICCKIDTTMYLVRRGADLNIKNQDGKTVLEFDINNVIKKIIQRERKEYEEKVIKAVKDNYIKNTQELLMYANSGNITDDQGVSLLMHAVKANNLKMVKLIIKNGANINYENAGKNALEFSSNEEITNFLKDKA